MFMASDPAIGEGLSLFQRAKAILMRPKDVWPDIARDQTPSGELFTRYAAPLAAIGPACMFFASQIYDRPYSLGLFAGLYRAVASYGVSLGGLLIMSFIASRLAKHYSGEGSPRDAFKLIAYSSTPAWLAGVAVLIPPLSFLSIFGLYSFYLFVQGVVPLMKVPEEKKAPFAFVTIGSAILLGAASNMLVASPTWNWGGGRDWGGPPQPIMNIQRDDSSDFSRSDFRKLMREVREAVRQRHLRAVPTDALQQLLPADIGAFHRTDIDSRRRGPGSEVVGSYEQGDREFSLKIVDLAGFGALAQLGMTFNVDIDGGNHEKIIVKDGKTTVEKWDSDDSDGTYATMVDKRFLIVADGEAENLDQLKTAVASVDPARLIALERKALPPPE